MPLELEFDKLNVAHEVLFFVVSEPASTFKAPILQSIFSCPFLFQNIVHTAIWEACFLYYVSDCNSLILQYYIMHFVYVFWSCDSSWRATTMFIFTGRSSTFKCTKPSFDYALRDSRFPQSCHHVSWIRGDIPFFWWNLITALCSILY